MNDQVWKSLVGEAYQVLNGNVDPIDGSGKLWRLADDCGLLPDFKKFVQFESDFDKAANGCTAQQEIKIRKAFIEDRQNDIFAEIGNTLLRLKEPVYTLQNAASLWLAGELETFLAMGVMRRAIIDLEIQDKQPYTLIYWNHEYFFEIPNGSDRQLWHADLIKAKEDSNAEFAEQIYEDMKVACTYIVEHPLKYDGK